MNPTGLCECGCGVRRDPQRGSDDTVCIVLLTHRCQDCGQEFRGQPGPEHPTDQHGRWCAGRVVEIAP